MLICYAHSCRSRFRFVCVQVGFSLPADLVARLSSGLSLRPRSSCRVGLMHGWVGLVPVFCAATHYSTTG